MGQCQVTQCMCASESLKVRKKQNLRFSDQMFSSNTKTLNPHVQEPQTKQGPHTQGHTDGHHN